MQTPLTYRTNRNLFSNYYLDKHLPETEEWDGADDEEINQAYDDILELWNSVKDDFLEYETNESQLENQFIRPLFEKLGIPYVVEESADQTQRRPDYGFFESDEAISKAYEHREEGGDFYENAVAVADAKRWGRALDTRGKKQRDFKNPSHQIDQYLRFTSTTWGVLTNGKKWRLYYRPTSHKLDSYYEVDLPTVLESGDLEDFKYFYLFFRHKAFLEDAGGDSFLDDVYDESNVFAQELGEDLQDNIYEAIKILAEGFLQFPDNDLNEDDLSLIHDSSLIYLYRVIFILYAEAEGRDLLDTDNEFYEEFYSLNSLKQEIAEELDSGNPKYRDWQDDLWSNLDELFKLIDQGSKSRDIPEEDLYIPAYNGGLFRTDPDENDSAETRFLANHKIGDAYLAQVIELLTRSANSNGGGKIFVDYSSLDIRHLGSVYEGLLEYQLNIADEPLALDDGEYVSTDDDRDVVVEEDDVYLTTDSGERKATGSYYTPEYVVDYIVENTLEPLVDDIRMDLAGQSGFGEGGFASEFADRIFELKVLDPAMGSGHFLTSAVDYLAREIIDAQDKQADQEGIETVNQEHDIYWARRQVAQRCIYGVDLNSLAVELSKVSLWLRTLAAEQPLAFLDHHLKTGNSLVGSNVEEIDALERNGTTDTEGPNSTLIDFGMTFEGTMENLMSIHSDIIAIENQELEDVKAMEKKYDEFKANTLRQRLEAIVDVYTAEEFDIDIPNGAYEEMAKALKSKSRWDKVQSKSWFIEVQELAEKKSFFNWRLEYPDVFYDVEGEEKDNPGFDVVLGNPPYINAIELNDITTHEKDLWKDRFDSARIRHLHPVLRTELGTLSKKWFCWVDCSK
jgi:type II restriction/modification system DNA methylase subunit YeeA